MKQIVFRYTVFATIAIIVFTAIHLFTMSSMSYEAAEVAGYLTMVLAMIFVFFGIRKYRDHVNNGTLTFGQGLKVGLLIALGPAVFFALFDLLYVKVINPDWSDEYYNNYIRQATKSTPPDELPEKLKKLNEQKEFFSNPVMLFLVMFVTVFVIGAIVTIISALTLRRNRTAAVA
jgi:hypothetical protein